MLLRLHGDELHRELRRGGVRRRRHRRWLRRQLRQQPLRQPLRRRLLQRRPELLWRELLRRRLLRRHLRRLGRHLLRVDRLLRRRPMLHRQLRGRGRHVLRLGGLLRRRPVLQRRVRLRGRPVLRTGRLQRRRPVLQRRVHRRLRRLLPRRNHLSIGAELPPGRGRLRPTFWRDQLRRQLLSPGRGLHGRHPGPRLRVLRVHRRYRLRQRLLPLGGHVRQRRVPPARTLRLRQRLLRWQLGAAVLRRGLHLLVADLLQPGRRQLGLQQRPQLPVVQREQPECLQLRRLPRRYRRPAARDAHERFGAARARRGHAGNAPLSPGDGLAADARHGAQQHRRQLRLRPGFVARPRLLVRWRERRGRRRQLHASGGRRCRG